MDTLEASRADVRARIASLRTALRAHKIDAWVVPSADPHLSEYLPMRWQGRQWLSGFTGSVGLLIVTPVFAGVWVDSRYWTQAEAQLAGTGINLMKIPTAASPAYIDWLAENVQPGGTVGADAAVLGLAQARAIEEKMAPRGIRVRTDLDLLAEVWKDRPALPTVPVYEHAPAFAPVTRREKLALLREEMTRFGVDWHLISTLDDIAWLTNLRGSDVSYNPVFVAHVLVGRQDATLFIAEEKVPGELKARLLADGYRVAPYAGAAAALTHITGGQSLLVDPRRITLALRQAVPAAVRVVETINPTTLAKSRKTAAEADHIRRAMEQDGAALAEFFAWLEAALARHDRITEITIDERITAARARRPGFVCPSFSTIAGFNANGALPHYRALPESHSVIADAGKVGNGLLLIDSGGQYENGTTDITRVVPIGATTAEQRRDFTLVLKGMIQLSMLQFPRGTRSPLIDAIARAPIWAAGIDFGHGTGHGVGYFLNVHEGPHGITPHLPPEPQTAMEPGMITSNEPGIYRPGKWGVRIENLLLNVPAGTSEFGEFLRFETLTLCPIDTRCIDRSLLGADEVVWLNAYHATVAERVGPLVTGDAWHWLQARTRAI